MKIGKAESSRSGLLRVALNGPGGSGKTATSLLLPDEMGKIAYIASDPNAPSMDSVPSSMLNRMIVLEPDGKPTFYDEAITIATMDFSKIDPEIGTLVWDTATETSIAFLFEVARKHIFSDKQATIGIVGKDPNNPLPTHYAQPDRADYMIAQGQTLALLQFLNQQPLHVICLFQQGESQPVSGSREGLLIGPAMAGSKGPRTIPQRFPMNLSIERGKTQKNPKGGVRVRLEPEGVYQAGYKGQAGSLPSEVILDETKLDQTSAFWDLLLTFKRKAAHAQD